MMNGAIAPPIEEPLSKRAVASPRSRFGNHSDTAFVAPGQFADSPAPSRKRNPVKLYQPFASDVRIETIEYHVTDSVNPRRVPIRSIKRPQSVCPSEYATRNAMIRFA